MYSFELFSEEFCGLFLEELDNYYASGLPVHRPNSMNNYGVMRHHTHAAAVAIAHAYNLPGQIIINHIGLKGAVTWLQQHVLHPLAMLLFPIQVCMTDIAHACCMETS